MRLLIILLLLCSCSDYREQKANRLPCINEGTKDTFGKYEHILDKEGEPVTNPYGGFIFYRECEKCGIKFRIGV